MLAAQSSASGPTKEVPAEPAPCATATDPALALVDDLTTAPDEAEPESPGRVLHRAKHVVSRRHPHPFEEAQLAVLMPDAHGATASHSKRRRACAPPPRTTLFRFVGHLGAEIRGALEEVPLERWPWLELA